MCERILFVLQRPHVAWCCLCVGLAHGVAAQELRSVDEKAIRQAVQSYTDAYNRHDANALADHWTSTGEFVMPTGQALQGREQIAKEFAAYFAEDKSLRLEIAGAAIDFLSPNVAVDTGSAVVISADQEPVQSEFVAVHVRTPEGWKLDSVRETESAETTIQNEKLQELDWMIGSWLDESEAASIQTHCHWTKNRSFLVRTFKVYVEGRVDAAGTQVVGWDPRHQTIRSWSFTSDGGFGAGAWSREGNRWMVRTTNVDPEGRRGSFTAIFDKVDDNTFEFSTVGREVDGQLMPNIDPVRIVRQ